MLTEIKTVPWSVREELPAAANAYAQAVAEHEAHSEKKQRLQDAVRDAAKTVHETSQGVADAIAAVATEEDRVKTEENALMRWKINNLDAAKRQWDAYQYHLKLQGFGQAGEWNKPIPPDPATLKGPEVRPVPPELLERRNALVSGAREASERLAAALDAMTAWHDENRKFVDAVATAAKSVVAARDELREAEQREEQTREAREREEAEMRAAQEAELAEKEAEVAAMRRALGK